MAFTTQKIIRVTDEENNKIKELEKHGYGNVSIFRYGLNELYKKLVVDKQK